MEQKGGGEMVKSDVGSLVGAGVLFFFFKFFRIFPFPCFPPLFFAVFL